MLARLRPSLEAARSISSRSVVQAQRTRQKEGPDTLAGRGRSLRLLAVWGTTGLLMSDAHASDLGSVLRDVTASTKRLSSHSKAAGPRNQRLCLVPHTCRFLGQQSLGCRTGVKYW
jgi:hypothetical protein